MFETYCLHQKLRNYKLFVAVVGGIAQFDITHCVSMTMGYCEKSPVNLITLPEWKYETTNGLAYHRSAFSYYFEIRYVT